jgi:thiamine-monophosphate kinase
VGEFELIARYFAQPARDDAAQAASGVMLGIGDDCALLDAQSTIAVSTDMLVEGRHFLPDVDPSALGHKCLAVNLSDLAAMGAQPFAYTLALSLPEDRARDEAWMSAFANGMHALARQHACVLVGGDTTAGPLTICITVMGRVDDRRALRRSAAKPGDDIYVSGCLGDAALALSQLQSGARVDEAIRERLERPLPRVRLGMELAGIAHACIDISDGLAGDLGHILAASRVAAQVDLAALPLSDAMRQVPQEQAVGFAVAGGDDYELCFTAAPDAAPAILAAGERVHVAVTCIGKVTAFNGVEACVEASGVRSDAGAIAWMRNGIAVECNASAFDHFA